MNRIKNNIIIINNNNITNERINYFDYLRIICSFFVVLIHVSAYYYSRLDIYSYKWKIANFYNGLSRFSVPNFFMISGAIFLNKELSFKIILNKYIKRVFIHLLIWSIIYSLIDANLSKLEIKSIIIQIIRGHYHLWYLYAIFGLYIIIPFIKPLIRNKKMLYYFLYFNILFLFIFPNYICLSGFYSEKFYQLLNGLISSLNINTLSIYNFYFILGYYLNIKKTIKTQLKIITYLTGLTGLYLTIKISYELSLNKNKKIDYFNFRYLNILFYSTSVFIFFKTNFNTSNKLIQKLAKYTFGIYLVHPFVIENIMQKLFVIFFEVNIIFLIPILNLIIFLLSLLICIILGSIPILGKYLI